MTVYCGNCGHNNRESTQFCQSCGEEIVATTSTGALMEGVMLDKRYEITELIKTGGMGAVYKALDHRFDKKLCAVKEMLSQAGGTSHDQDYMIDRFKKEAHILNELRHPNMPVVRDYFVQAGRYYLVMDYIEGKDLEVILEEHLAELNLLGLSEDNGAKGLPEEKVIEWMKQILDALDYLHSLNPPIVYRDLKPSNIILRKSDGRAMIIDFGIARTVKAETILNTKTATGTPAFAPPELFEGKPVPRTDIYSLGATMHCLLTGEIPLIPFSFNPVRELNPAISEELEAIVMKALEQSVDDRYENAKEMKKVLEDYTDSHKSSVAQPQKVSSAPPDNKKSKLEEDSESTLTPIKTSSVAAPSRSKITTQEKLAQPASSPTAVPAEEKKKSRTIMIAACVITGIVILCLAVWAALVKAPQYCKHEAEINFEKHNYDNARNWYKTLSHLNPAMARSDTNARKNLLAMAEGDPKNLIAYCNTGLSIYPNNIQFLLKLGNATKDTDPNSAIGHYKRVKDILATSDGDNDKKTIYPELAKKFSLLKDTKDAADCYEEVFKMAPDNQDALVFLLDYYIKNKTYAKAVIFADTLAKKSPSDKNVIVNLGTAYYKETPPDYNRANLWFQKALPMNLTSEEKNPIVSMSSDCYVQRGNLLLKDHNYDDARDSFQNSLNMVKGNKDAQTGLGKIARYYLTQGKGLLGKDNYDGAKSNFNKALDLKLYLDSKEVDEAKKGIEKAVPVIEPTPTPYTGPSSNETPVVIPTATHNYDSGPILNDTPTPNYKEVKQPEGK